MLRFICLLLALAPLVAAAAPSPLPLSPRETRNLTTLTKLVGDVKYFYPNRHTARLSWETVLVRSIPAVRRAPTAAALARTLDSLIRPLAPEVRIQVAPAAAPVPAAPLPATPAYYFWEHHGLGLDKTGLPVVRVMMRLAGLPYASAIRQEPKAVVDSLFPDGQHQYVAALTDSVRLVLPLVLTQTQHRQPLQRQQARRVRRLMPSESSHRLATVMLTWNIIQHFYTYREVLTEAQWEAALALALQQAANTTTQAELLQACRVLLARLPDRHVRMSPKTRTGLSIVPPPWALQLAWVEGQVVVCQSPQRLRPALAPGTVVTQVNGRPVAELLTELEGTIPATSPAVARQVATEALLSELAATASTANLTLQDSSGASYSYSLAFKTVQGSLYNQLPPVQEVAPGCFYLDANRLRYADFRRALPQLQAARALVVDIRQRPTYDLLRILPHFSPQPLLPDSTATPVLRQPNFYHAAFRGATARAQAPQLPLLPAPKAFLVGPHTYSYGETIAELVRRHHLGLLVGQPTGGTNGEMNFAAVGRAYLLSWTGRRVMHRGVGYQGKGIAPDILVTPTRQNIRLGQDAELARALERLQLSAPR
ncbi:hypothetical protein K3G63_03605 [Hymenobacter sp. HSC-4F20]|uniref:S41 family peptidase n=1 Tax=Hymenobacter sp. HSC-4F20 TaxID=2864135 RepID=UPI001C72F68D|nr:S41 family peptidase [Hymenobacter sp. HSC-4F20]MBX0289506.1 hypothetical protein [Hymenobacter sp. HSC-4F20]